MGSGAFGKVVEATAYGLGTDDVTRVAVKMLKRQSTTPRPPYRYYLIVVMIHIYISCFPEQRALTLRNGKL